MLAKPPTERAMITTSAPSRARPRSVVAFTDKPMLRTLATWLPTSSIRGSASGSVSIKVTSTSHKASELAKSTRSLGVQCVLPPPTMVIRGVPTIGTVAAAIPACRTGGLADPTGAAVIGPRWHGRRRTLVGMPDGIDIVLFDLGGVLVDFGGVGAMRELAGIDSDDELWRRWLSSPSVRAFERGQCSAADFAAGVVDEWGIAVSPEKFLAEFSDWPRGPLAGAIDL